MAASMCFASRIGVLKGENACPGESVTIQLNTEDNDPRTGIGLQQIGTGGGFATSSCSRSFNL